MHTQAVFLLEAKNLPQMDGALMKSDPYVIITVPCADRSIHFCFFSPPACFLNGKSAAHFHACFFRTRSVCVFAQVPIGVPLRFWLLQRVFFVYVSACRRIGSLDLYVACASK